MSIHSHKSLLKNTPKVLQQSIYYVACLFLVILLERPGNSKYLPFEVVLFTEIDFSARAAVKSTGAVFALYNKQKFA